MMLEISQVTKMLLNIRAIGGIVAADLRVDANRKRAGYAVYQRAVKLGALLRPLGNTLYWLPPLNIEQSTLRKLQHITAQALSETL